MYKTTYVIYLCSLCVRFMVARLLLYIDDSCGGCYAPHGMPRDRAVSSYTYMYYSSLSLFISLTPYLSLKYYILCRVLRRICLRERYPKGRTRGRFDNERQRHLFVLSSASVTQQCNTVQR